MRAIIRLLYQKLFMQMMRMRLKKVGRKNIEAGRSKSTVKVLLPFGLKKACSVYTFSKLQNVAKKEYANVELALCIKIGKIISDILITLASAMCL